MLLILSFPLCIFSGNSDVQFSDSFFSFEDYPLQLNFRFSRSLLVLSNFIIELPGKIGIVYLISFLICKKRMHRILFFCAFSLFYFSLFFVVLIRSQAFFARSFTTSPAIINPATDGTNATLPGMARRSVHLCSAPGGQMQFVRQLIDISSIGLVGFSSE